MNYEIALRMADAAFIGIWLAPIYFILRTLFAFSQRFSRISVLRSKILYVIQKARLTHPYIGLTILLLVPYHVYVMIRTHEASPKGLLGISTLVVAGFTIGLGFFLWRNRANVRIRSAHRWCMFILLAVATWHKYFKL